ncbi:hypothetical protein [Streptomyces sp. NPDC048172]|uniref:hypothetical protein n=1 Tax=Streptomyces sp. NPDC048172 TaxID=3365505 RepID=UPI003718AA81
MRTVRLLALLPEFLTWTVALGRAVVTHSVTWPRADPFPEPLVLPLELVEPELELEPELEPDEEPELELELS